MSGPRAGRVGAYLLGAAGLTNWLSKNPSWNGFFTLFAQYGALAMVSVGTGLLKCYVIMKFGGHVHRVTASPKAPCGAKVLVDSTDGIILLNTYIRVNVGKAEYRLSTYPVYFA